METKNDVRFQRVENLIHNAIIELLYEKSFNQITVEDICQKAQISRSGFYLHYKDKDDLIEQYVQNIISTGTAAFLSNIKSETLMFDILNYFYNDGKLLGLLISDNGSINIQKMILLLLQENAKENLLTSMNIKTESATELRYLISYLSTASFGVLQEWVNSGQKESPKEMTIVMRKVLSALKTLHVYG
jgi:AcrR family transcriptional regulator